MKLSSEAVENQECILFLGAGVHAPPPEGSAFEYAPEQRLPIGSALSRQLAEECDFAEQFPGEDPGNLQRVALAYEIDSSRIAEPAALREVHHRRRLVVRAPAV